MTESERTTPPAAGDAGAVAESPDRWGAGLTRHSRGILAEFADWFARTEAPDLADFVEKALVLALSDAELTYSLDSGGLLADFPSTDQFESVSIELPDKVTEVLASVNGGPLAVPPSAAEMKGLARTRAMLARWLELVDARLLLQTEGDLEDGA